MLKRCRTPNGTLIVVRQVSLTTERPHCQKWKVLLPKKMMQHLDNHIKPMSSNLTSHICHLRPRTMTSLLTHSMDSPPQRGRVNQAVYQKHLPPVPAQSISRGSKLAVRDDHCIPTVGMSPFDYSLKTAFFFPSRKECKKIPFFFRLKLSRV